jgi:3-(3-hydroxy-phenyl)propionate hydroxylase
MSPEPGVEMAFRNAALSLAVDTPFARRVVNAGRLSVPCHLDGSPLNSRDDGSFDVPQKIGMVALDAPLSDRDGRATWLMSQLGGRFVCLVTGDAEAPAALPDDVDLVRVGRGGFGDADGRVQERYGHAVYLIRPDQHVAARWLAPGPDDIRAALVSCAAAAAVTA